MGIWLGEDERSQVLRAVLEAWPEPHAPQNLAWLGEGFGSAAFETPDGIVVLVAKNEIGAHSRRVTCALTPELAPALDIAVPIPLWRVERADGLPFGAYAYHKVAGRTWTFEESVAAPDSVVDHIAAFLKAVHAFSVDRALEIGLPSFEDSWADIVALRSALQPPLREHLTPNEFEAVEAWWETFLTDEMLWYGPRSVVHGDLWWVNVLLDDEGEQLLGVIDFGDAGIVDPAYDFVPLYESAVTAGMSPDAGGSPLLARYCDAYRRLDGLIDRSFEHRLRRWWELRSASLFSLRAAMVHDDPAELQDCLLKLRRSPILHPGSS